MQKAFKPKNKNEQNNSQDKKIALNKKSKPDLKNKISKNQKKPLILQNNYGQANNLNLQKVKINPNAKVIKAIDLSFFQKNVLDQYEQDIISFLRSEHKKYEINSHYINFHKTLNAKMRLFLLKFIFKICQRFRCKRKTLFLAVFIFDKFLSKNTSISQQIVFITVAQASIYIAMKNQEIYPPSISQWTDKNQFQNIMSMQSQILKQLDFNINFPSIAYFEQYLQKKHYQSQQFFQNKQNYHLQQIKIKLVSDMCLFDLSLYDFKPFDIIKSIRKMVYNEEITFEEERLVLNLKWMVQRNRGMMEWLKQIKYKQLIEVLN